MGVAKTASDDARWSAVKVAPLPLNIDFNVIRRICDMQLATPPKCFLPSYSQLRGHQSASLSAVSVHVKWMDGY